MSFIHRKNPAGLSYLVCEPLERAGFLNAFSTRAGDADFSKERFAENIGAFSSAIGAAGWDVKTALQTHSDVRLDVDSTLVWEGDALIAKKPNVLTGVKTADCLPVLLADSVTGVSAAIHAGWRGTLARIVEKTVGDLKEKFGVRPENLLAALGPAACGDCYEVGEDVVGLFRSEFRTADGFFRWSRARKMTLDVAAVNRHQLTSAGLRPTNIFTTPFCTMHQNELFFSHRREGQASSSVGRQLAVIGRAGR